jgi:hypothetical protein
MVAERKTTTVNVIIHEVFNAGRYFTVATGLHLVGYTHCLSILPAKMLTLYPECGIV